jgi:hypothetical protein
VTGFENKSTIKSAIIEVEFRKRNGELIGLLGSGFEESRLICASDFSSTQEKED